MGTYNATVLPCNDYCCFVELVTDPFKYSITPFIQTDYLHVTISVRVSSVSKIACVIAASDSKPETLEYLESKDTRYYIRTNQESKLAFRVNYLSKENQRLFCNITGLLYSPAHVEFYKSDPFWVDCILIELVIYVDETVKLNQLQCDKTSFSFSYQPNQIKLQFSPQDYSERKYLVLCESAPLPGTIVDCQQPHLFCSIGTLPMKIHGEVSLG